MIDDKLRCAMESQALADYRRYAGKIMMVTEAVGYRGDDSVDLRFYPPVAMRVDRMPLADFDRHNVFWPTWNNLDPYYDLTPVNPNDPQVKGYSSFFYYGPSYDAAKPFDAVQIERAEKEWLRYMQPATLRERVSVWVQWFFGF